MRLTVRRHGSLIAAGEKPKSGILLKKLGWILYAGSWFVQVHQDGTTLAKGGLPGWEAFSLSMWVIIGPFTDPAHYRFDPLELPWLLSGLTNLLFIVSPVTATGRRRRCHGAFPWLLLLATGLNGQWLFYYGSELRAGYYLWWGAFMITTYACFLARRRTGQSGGHT